MANLDKVMEKAFARNERNVEVLAKLFENPNAWEMVRDGVLKAVYREAGQSSFDPKSRHSVASSSWSTKSRTDSVAG